MVFSSCSKKRAARSSIFTSIAHAACVCSCQEEALQIAEEAVAMCRESNDRRGCDVLLVLGITLILSVSWQTRLLGTRRRTIKKTTPLRFVVHEASVRCNPQRHCECSCGPAPICPQ